MMPHLHLYNSETLTLEPFHKNPPDRVTLYTCGPTVYNFAHIGNFRTYVFEDVLRRALNFFGYRVVQAMNLTDVDDKTIKGAIANDLTLDEFTKPFKEAFFADLKALNIEPVEFYPEATTHIPEMIEMIEELLKKGIAYYGQDGSVYYAISRFPQYGRLAHLSTQHLKAGASERNAHDEYDKENISDFVLWKAYDPSRDGKIFWESPFGKGRPGWHIECSAMAMKHLGKTLDIHVGGVDNLFPHHENEIAQSEACTECQFVKHWCHSEHLLVDGKKMSKSLGNFFTLRDLLEKGYTGIEVRYALMQSHYRMQLNFSLTALDAAASSLKRINTCFEQLQNYQPAPHDTLDAAFFNRYAEDFKRALAHDLNLAECFAIVFSWVKDVNTGIAQSSFGPKDQKALLDLILNFNKVLGILVLRQEAFIPEAVTMALAQRNQARAHKNYAEADRLRKWIEDQGFQIEDTPKGAIVKPHNTV
jgi:cysteinyl-tRNA synthetase